MQPNLPFADDAFREGVTLTVTLSAELTQALDEWIAVQPQPQPTREEAVQAMVEAALKLADEPTVAEDPQDGPCPQDGP